MTPIDHDQRLPNETPIDPVSLKPRNAGSETETTKVVEGLQIIREGAELLCNYVNEGLNQYFLLCRHPPEGCDEWGSQAHLESAKRAAAAEELT